MRKGIAKKVGLAAVILLAPGGFVLGAALLADRYRKGEGRSSAADTQGVDTEGPGRAPASD